VVMTTTTSLADAKSHLSAIVASAELTHERTIITKNGRPAAIIIGIDDFEGMEMTMEILRDPLAMAEIREGEAAVARGDFSTLEEIKADLEARKSKTDIA
jgi:antitoxin YefM